MKNSMISTLFVGWLLAVCAGAPAAIAAQDTEIVGFAGKCLDVRGSSTAEGADVILFRCRGTANQRWSLPPLGFTGEIRGLEGKCLDVRGGVAQDRAQAEMRSCDGAATQRWRFGQDGRIVGDQGFCLDVLGGASSDLTPIIVFGCHGKGNQLWRPREEGRFTLTHLETDADVSDLWIDPDRPQLQIARVYPSGLFRSEDGGESWSPLYEGFDPPSLDVRLVSVNRAANRVLYARRSYRQHLRSIDGGRSWQQLEHDFGISALVADGKRTRNVFAADGDGRILESGDLGRTWQPRGQLPEGEDISSVWLFSVPGRSGRLIASTELVAGSHHTAPGGVFRSLDGGRTWRLVLPDLIFDEVSFDPHDSDRMLARQPYGGVFRSRNGGASWGQVTPPGAVFVDSMVIDTVQPDRVLVSDGQRLYLSEDFGDSWALLPVDFETGSYSQLRLLTVAPGGALYASLSNPYGPDTNDEGFFRSDDFGQTWAKHGRGLANADVWKVVTTAGIKDVYALGGDGLFAAVDGGTRWRRLRQGPHTVLAIDPFDAKHLIASEPEGVTWSSTDGGKTFVTTASPSDSTYFQMAFDPVRRGRVFAAAPVVGGEGVFRSIDGGASWRQVFTAEPSSPQLAVGAEGRVWLAVSDHLRYSPDAGTSWIDVSVGCNSCYVRDLAADRSVAGRVWVVLYEGLRLSQDGGASWTEVALPTRPDGSSVEVGEVAAADGVLFVREYLGPVWRSSDSGASWSLLAAGLPSDTYSRLAIDGVVPGRIWAAVSGLGVLVGDFPR